MAFAPARPTSSRTLRRRRPGRVGAVIAASAAALLAGLAGPGLASPAPSAAATPASTYSVEQSSTPGPVVAFAPDTSGGGWTVTASGAVSSYGSAPLHGSPAALPLAKPIVGMAATPDGGGYWLVASDGGIFSYGDATFHGSTGAMRLNQPIVGMAATPDGGGYWLVASDGGIFSFGDARFFGSTGAMRLDKPVVGMAAVGRAGYLLVAADGGLFAFGTAPFRGSMGGQRIAAPITGVGTNPGGGYWEVASDGGVFAFGAPFLGAPGGKPLVGVSAVDGGPAYAVANVAGTVFEYGEAAAPASSGSTSPTPAPSTTVPAPTSTTPAPTTTTTAPVSSGPSELATATGLFPLGLFDRPTGAQPLSPNSATYVSNLVSQYQTYYGAVGVNFMPVFNVPAGQPMVTVNVRSGCNNFQTSTGTSVPIPADAYTTDPNYQHDSAIVIDQPSTHTEWELWEAANDGDGTWSACWGGKLNTATSNGVFPSPYGLSASGISYLSTMITEADVQSGSINHALSMDVARCNYSTAPADRGDCSSDPGQPPEGTWFRMPASVQMPAGLTPLGQMVFRALQTYGAVVMDQAGAVMFQSESTEDWATSGHSGTDPITSAMAGRPEYSVLNGMPWSSLQVITPPSS